MAQAYDVVRRSEARGEGSHDRGGGWGHYSTTVLCTIHTDKEGSSSSSSGEAASPGLLREAGPTLFGPVVGGGARGSHSWIVDSW
jgi:hypothetical protein